MSSLEILNLPLIEVPDSSGHFIDHVVIVSHQQHRASYRCSAIFRALMDSRSR